MFQSFIGHAANVAGGRIQTVRTDGGTEYLGDLSTFLETHGIEHQKTPPHSPQSNGVAERLNRTLNESIRAMLFTANMPESFWAEAVITATYIWNRLPSAAIQNKTPYEL